MTSSPTDTGAGHAPGVDVEQRVYDSISRALLQGKLRPGTALRERALAEMFDCTRGAIRKVLGRLGQEGKLELLQNRGAFVPQPCVQDIKMVYEARSAIEAGIIALLGRSLDAQQVKQLNAHVAAEQAAWRSNSREESVRLAGEFHLRLLEMTGNAELRPVLQQLISRSQLFVALYEPHSDSHCAPEEHHKIADALTRGDIHSAIDAMLQHLHEVQARVLSHANLSADQALVDILAAK